MIKHPHFELISSNTLKSYLTPSYTAISKITIIFFTNHMLKEIFFLDTKNLVGHIKNLNYSFIVFFKNPMQIYTMHKIHIMQNDKKNTQVALQ